MFPSNVQAIIDLKEGSEKEDLIAALTDYFHIFNEAPDPDLIDRLLANTPEATARERVFGRFLPER